LTIEVPSSAPPSTGDYLVRFFDIDGTILKEEYVDAGNSATAPSNPTYDSTYLTFKEWNKTFSVVNQDTDVGAIYDTIDGKTYLFLRITNTTGLQPALRINKSNTALMTIDWGDATTNTSTSSGDLTITKTAAYSAIGDYVVSIECAGGYGINSGGYLLGNNTTYAQSLIRAYFGINFTTIVTNGLRVHRSLQIVSISDNITSIGFFAFQECYSLQCCILPNSLTSLSNNSYVNCSSLITCVLPLTISALGSNIFQNCRSLINITIPSTITSIGNLCFNGCVSIRKIKIPQVTTLGESAFQGCSSLENIILGNTITIFNNTTFSGCITLRSINMPTSLTSVGAQCFINCESLKELEFDSLLTTIAGFGQNFQNCLSILEYTFLSTTPPTLASTNAFTGINAACKIYVPDANVAAYQSATNWVTYANYIYPLSTKP
jgi:hypothetical protein